MSTVYLHIGQCGVQLGQEIWTKAASRATDDVNLKHVLWSGDNPRSLFIDGERKVVQKFANDIRKLKVKRIIDVTGNSICCRKGCGSNWALGYNDMAKATLGKDLPKIRAGYGQYLVDNDSPMLEVCTEAIRVKIESCDNFMGFIGVHGLGGGTGSGWGSRLCKELRDLYPTAYRLWNVIVPHSSGESPTQHYNQLLSLATLQENADAIVLFDNDKVLSTLQKQGDLVSLKDMNKLIADTILSLYSPISSLIPPGDGISIGIEPWELIRFVAPIPQTKFLQASYIDESMLKNRSPLIWEQLLKTLTSRWRSDNLSNSKKSSCMAALGVCRGIGQERFLDLQEVAKKLKTTYSCVDWNPRPIDLWTDEIHKSSSRKGVNTKKSIAVCANVTSSGIYCQNVLDKSKLMFDNRAYTHWYSRYGTQDDDFNEAFATLHTIVKEYEKI